MKLDGAKSERFVRSAPRIRSELPRNIFPTFTLPPFYLRVCLKIIFLLNWTVLNVNFDDTMT